MKVTDFKSCRFTDPSSALQEKEAIALFGEIMGTPLYMSPEQAKGLDPDAPSDIYSMGATMFHALTGTAPFEGSSMYETLRDHIDAVPQLERIPEEFWGVDRESTCQRSEAAVSENLRTWYCNWWQGYRNKEKVVEVLIFHQS